MRTLSRLIVLFAILFLAGCTGQNQVEVDNQNFRDQIDQLQNLEFTFNNDLAPDSIIEIWDSIPFIEFTPHINGRFKWANKRQLVFSPTGPFAPNTDYKAEFSDLILNLSPKALRFKENIVNFHTPYLDIESTNAYWNRNEAFSQQLELRVKLIFNNSVEQDQIQKFISLNINGTKRSFRLLPSDINTEGELAVEMLSEDDIIKSLEVVVANGMKAIGSDRENPEPIHITIPVPSTDKLEITGVTTEFEGGMGVITIYTSQPIETQGLESKVQIDPNVAYEASPINNGFILKGDFIDGHSYQLLIKKSLRGIFGPELASDIQQPVTFGSLQPFIAFEDEQGMYLTPGGSGNLGLRIINVPKVKITMFRVFENNIQHYMRNGKEWEWYSDENNYYDSYDYRLNEDYGQVIKVREINTNALPKKGNLRLLNINSNDLNISSDLKGIYLVRAESPDKAWLNDVQLLSYSDLGLIVKEGEDEIFVATRSIATGKAIGNVTINFYSNNNQMVHKQVTGGDGITIFKDLKKTIPGFKISMITARKGDDFNVLLFNQSAVEVTRFEVGGKRTTGLEYDVFLYGDRNLYRPGDSVFCNTILRDFRPMTITGFPLIFRVIAPDGRDFLKQRVMVNNNGAAQLKFVLPAKAYTGTYICEVLTVNNVLIGNYRINVEEFMPDRISVAVKSDKTSYLPGDILKVDITALNLSGPPAVGRKVENELRINRKSFFPKAYNQYNFSIVTREYLSIMSTINQTVTSGTGKAEQLFSLPAFKNTGLLEGTVFTTVFDETGRPVNRLLRFDMYTQSTFLGILPLPGWLSTGKPLALHLIALNNKEKSIPANARLEIIHVNWETVLERNYGQTNYRSVKKETLLLSKAVSIEASGSTETYIPQKSGEYIVRVSLPESNSWIEETFYAYKWGDSDASSFKVNKDGQIDITFDKSGYQPGEVAKVLFKTPFTGELLVTVEQNKVLEYHTLKADNNGASMQLKVRDNFIPNVYVTATLLRKTIEPGIPLTVAHGFASMNVENPSNKLAVSIISPEIIRSDVKQKVKVKTTPGAEVTLAIVDEGILQITDYKSPDPYGYFYQKRALEVNAYDLFDELLPELSTKRSSVGGDQGFDLGKRLNPLTTKRVKLLSLWSGQLTAGTSGEVTFTANIPHFTGAVRIMAVAYKDSKFGSAEKKMRVSDPVNISSSIPRFLSPGDLAKVQVTLTNTTSKPINATLNVSVSGPLSIELPSPHKIMLPANTETPVIYQLTAHNKTGIGNITFKVLTPGETFTEKTELGIRPAVPLVKEASAGVIAAGNKLTVGSSTTYMKSTGTSRLLLTQNPAGQYANQLQELINYPYGCTEQTISAAFPQLYFNDLAKLLKKKNINGTSEINNNVNEAIRKVITAQQYNGGLEVWPGSSTVSWWNTAYAAHFLYEAQKAGFTVDKQVSDNLHKYLLEMLKQKGTTEYSYKADGSDVWLKKMQPNREIFYSLYVLALSGKHHMPTMNYYKAKADQLSIDSRYLLALTYNLAGDQKSYQLLLPKSWDKLESAIMSGDSYSSPIRDCALSLYTLLSVDANNPQIPVLARQTSQLINSAKWMNTQERAFSMLALGKLANLNAKSEVTATITFNNKTVNFNGDDLIIDILGTKASITTHGKGNLYWYLESEGLPESGKVQQEDRYLKVRRILYNRDGTLHNGNKFKQNELVVIAITVSTTDNSIIDNVVITELLPACFEVENSRLTADRELEWIKDRQTPEYLDIRDDRVNLFTSASAKPRTFYYLVRVVNKGSYIYGPVGAEAMYNGQYYSYHGLTKLVAD